MRFYVLWKQNFLHLEVSAFHFVRESVSKRKEIDFPDLDLIRLLVQCEWAFMVKPILTSL